jgi:GNAT superfamily N-acetyltransferase
MRTATRHDSALIARLYDQARQSWPEFSPESPAGIESAIADDGMVYLLIEDRAAVCLHADPEHRYGFLDFPYAMPDDAGALVEAALAHLANLRVECPLPVGRVWEAELLSRCGFKPGETQRRMVRQPSGLPPLPQGTRLAQLLPAEVEALHARVFTGYSLKLGWHTDPERSPIIGLKLGERVAGYALSSVQNGVYWLSEVAVHPELRRRGFGRALTLLALRQMQDAGATEIHLYVNDDHDQHAPRLYESLGFETRLMTVRYVRDA